MTKYLNKTKLIIKGLERIGIEYLPYLPCGAVSDVLEHFERKKNTIMIPLSREEEGIGIMAGLEACKKKAVLFMQDSGIGNALNAYISLGVVYRIPMLILVSRRGGFNEINEANAAFGEVVPQIIAACRTEYFILDYKIPYDEWSNVIVNSYQYAHIMSKPVIVLINSKK